MKACFWGWIRNQYIERTVLTVYDYLSRFDSEEVEDIFIRYLLEYEYDSTDIIRKTVDEYLNTR